MTRRAAALILAAAAVRAAESVPKFEQLRTALPQPILESKPRWVAAYWKAWEFASRNFHEPSSGSGFPSRFIDAAFSDNIYFWDTAFMTMFCNVAAKLVPGIESLDNFYAKQHPDGEIAHSREDRHAGSHNIRGAKPGSPGTVAAHLRDGATSS